MSPTATIDVRIDFADTGVALRGRWTPLPAERQAAWEILVELTTRITLIPLREGEGLMTEALSSLHGVFGATRQTLSRNGPELAEHRVGELSFAVIAGHMLNQVLRPVTAYWHPELQHWLDGRSGGQTVVKREAEWPELEEFRAHLERLRTTLVDFANVFGQACGAEEYLRIQLDNESRLYEESVRRRAQGRERDQDQRHGLDT